MVKSVRYPNGPWPAEMRADMAAAYLDEPSVESFLKKVGHIYPYPVRGLKSSRKWSKETLDRTIANRHGLLRHAEDIVELI